MSDGALVCETRLIPILLLCLALGAGCAPNLSSATARPGVVQERGATGNIQTVQFVVIPNDATCRLSGTAYRHGIQSFEYFSQPLLLVFPLLLLGSSFVLLFCFAGVFSLFLFSLFLSCCVLLPCFVPLQSNGQQLSYRKIFWWQVNLVRIGLRFVVGKHIACPLIWPC